MKNKSIILLLLLLYLIACSKDNDIDSLDNIIAPEYNLPKGNPGTVDAKIYDIFNKYETFVLYSFERTDFRRLWTSEWHKWYAPANTSDDLKYVSKFVDFLEKDIFGSYEPEFIKNNFPYKVFLVDTLCDAATYTASKVSKVLSNGNNAIAISNVGLKSDSWKEQDWNLLKADINNAFTLFYYSALDEKPIQFMSLGFKGLSMPILKDPLGELSKYDYSCYSAGYIRGLLKTTYLIPKEPEDFADYISFLTTKSGSFLNRVFERFPILKARAIVLYIFLKNKMNMDLVATQNINHPEDMVTSDLFKNN